MLFVMFSWCNHFRARPKAKSRSTQQIGSKMTLRCLESLWPNLTNRVYQSPMSYGVQHGTSPIFAMSYCSNLLRAIFMSTSIVLLPHGSLPHMEKTSSHPFIGVDSINNSLCLAEKFCVVLNMTHRIRCVIKILQRLCLFHVTFR